MSDDRDYGERDSLFNRATWDVDIDQLLEQSREEQLSVLERLKELEERGVLEKLEAIET
jgi:hypothetical protein